MIDLATQKGGPGMASCQAGRESCHSATLPLHNGQGRLHTPPGPRFEILEVGSRSGTTSEVASLQACKPATQPHSHTAQHSAGIGCCATTKSLG